MSEVPKGKPREGDYVGTGNLSEARATEPKNLISKFRAYVAIYYGNVSTCADEMGARNGVNADGYSSKEQEALDSR